jgi:hypothetical protein
MTDKEKIEGILLEAVWVTRWINKDSLAAVLEPEEAIKVVEDIFNELDKEGFEIRKKRPKGSYEWRKKCKCGCESWIDTSYWDGCDPWTEEWINEEKCKECGTVRDREWIGETIVSKLMKLVSKEPSKWLERAKERKKNNNE